MIQRNIYVIDLFAGFGGVTTGASKVPGVKVIACVNHDPLAIKSHAANHPECIHYIEDIKTLNLTELVNLVEKIRKEDPDGLIMLWASLECTNHSIAKGGMSRDADSRTLANHLIESEDLHGHVRERYVPLLNPDIIFIENVKEFKIWGPLEIKVVTHKKKVPVWPYCPLDIKKDKKTKTVSFHPVWVGIKALKGTDFNAWKNKVESFGYVYEDRILNAADFGAFTSRKRYFAQFVKPHVQIGWPKQTHVDRRIIEKGKINTKGLLPWMAVRNVLELEKHGESIFGRRLKNGKRKNLSDKTYERIYHGLIKFVAGGKKNFLVNYHHSSQSESMENPIGALTTKDKKAIANVQFIDKAFSGSPEHKSSDIDNPGPTVKCVDNSSLATVQFIDKYNGDKPESRNVSIDEPAPTVMTSNSASLISPEFISTYHGSGDNCHSIDGPSPAIPTHDSAAIIRAERFVMNNFSGGGQHTSLEGPGNSVMPVVKSNLITADQFIQRDFGNATNQSVDNPSGTLTSEPKSNLVSVEAIEDGKEFFLINPQYVNSGASVNQPCFTIIARTDKYPPYLVVLKSGHYAIMIEEGDTPHMIKIKEFMAMYGIADVKMRMFFIKELLKIQGFDSDYKMFGTQTDHKRFIGNAVEVTQAEVLFKACVEANQYEINSIAV